MSIQLTIVGLGQIGASIGLALANQGDKITRIGTDINRSVMQQAQRINAIDKAVNNLNSAVNNADIVILSLPSDQIRDTVKTIAPVLKEEAILMDTAPVKVMVAEWMEEYLPKTCHYIGLTPVLNPAYLFSTSSGIEAAKTDLFEKTLFAMVTLPGVNARALQLATDLIQLMGASPLFIDLYEIDGLMAATHTLPALLSIALIEATLDHPGWNEARKVAGRSFTEIVGPASHLDDAEALSETVKLNKANILRKLDDIIAVMQDFRQDIDQVDTKRLDERIKRAKVGVDRWWQERGAGNWLEQELPSSQSLPTSGEIMGGLLGFGLGRKKKKDR